MAKILIVDDEPEILKILAFLLRSDGQEPVMASDGPTALNLLAEQPIDLMVSDLRMAPMDGLDLLRNAHARFPHLPVIILTAHSTADLEQEALRNGAFDYLTKPFKADKLFLTIRRALDDARKKLAIVGKCCL